jgi:hypothetical protein
MKSTGFIYAIKFGDAVKIGNSRQPEKRIRTISAMNGCSKPEYYISDEVENQRSIELKIHKHLDSRKIHSETFAIELCEAVKVIDSFCVKVTDERKSYLKEQHEAKNRATYENFKQIIEPVKSEITEHEMLLDSAILNCNAWLDNFGTQEDLVEMMNNLQDPIALMMLTGEIKSRAIGALLSALNGDEEDLMKLGFSK